MFPEDTKEIFTHVKNIKVTLSHLDVQGVERICNVFYGRYTTEISNGYFMINLQGITYDEFCQLIGIYAYFINFGKLHIIPNPPSPRTDYLITAMK